MIQEHDSSTWSYSCQCIRCRWEQWWHEGNNAVIEMPDERHPDGEFDMYFDQRESWNGLTHPNDYN